MKKKIPKSRGGKRPGAGRPATGRDPVTAIRLPDALTEAIDAWRRKQDDLPSRSEAIRRLLEVGLAAKPTREPTAKAAARAADLAAEVIDSRQDQSVPAEERDQRKRRLLKGPSAFREIRRDRPKGK